jgi:sulfite reductase alpha subunit-like flavoprotein
VRVLDRVILIAVRPFSIASRPANQRKGVTLHTLCVRKAAVGRRRPFSVPLRPVQLGA